MAHKVADAVYSRITGESPYFDSRVVFVSESGPKDARQKRLAVMDYDGANVQYLTDSKSIVLAPRFSPAGDRILYTSYATGFPRIYLMSTSNLSTTMLDEQPGTMTFAPRFAPDGHTVVFSMEKDGNSDLYTMNVDSGGVKQLTDAPSIETAPSFSPDGSQIVFESDRSGAQQIYTMPAGGGEPNRISSGKGKYGTPVWSPRGDLIAFTKIADGRFYIGVIRPDGTDERLLTASFLDEGPTWAPNGRVIMFTRESEGAAGSATLYSVDVSGLQPGIRSRTPRVGIRSGMVAAFALRSLPQLVNSLRQCCYISRPSSPIIPPRNKEALMSVRFATPIKVALIVSALALSACRNPDRYGGTGGDLGTGGAKGANGVGVNGVASTALGRSVQPGFGGLFQPDRGRPRAFRGGSVDHHR